MENQAPAAVQTAENRVTKEVTYGKVEVSRVYAGTYQKEGTLTAELKQTVTTKASYPSKSVTSNFQDNPFTNAEFGFSNQDFDSVETRVAWIDVPAGSTVESVTARLAQLPEMRLYKILSNHPNLSDNQAAGIQRGFTTKDIIANSQAVRYPATHPTHAGKLILDINGKVQYRGVYFKASIQEDLDKRTEDVKDMYLTPELLAELTPATANVASDKIN